MFVLLTKPYVILPPPAIVPDMGVARSRLSLEGDVLTILCRSAAPQVYLAGGVNEPMQRITETDVWALRLQMAGWDRAFLGYCFVTDPAWQFPMTIWRGPRAPATPTRTARLQGRIVETKFNSPALGERRRVFVYLPPSSKGPLPAIYMTDGAQTERFAKILEPLIIAGKIRACAIVGTDHGGYRGTLLGKPYDERLNYRMREYVPNVDPVRFAHHRQFFVDEVPAWAERRFRLSRRREDRALFGVSDGARFVLAIAIARPHAYGNVLAFSPAGPVARAWPTNGPRLMLTAGRLESPIDRWASDLARRVPGARLDITVSGHDPEQWELEFARLAPLVFRMHPKRPSRNVKTYRREESPAQHLNR